MKRFLLHVAVFASTSLLLQACAPLAPGFSSASSDAAQAVSPSGFSTPDIDPPPPGAITEITPALLRAQRAAVSRALSPDVMALIGEPQPYKIGPGDVVGIVVYDHPEIVFSATPATTVADPASISPAPGYIVSGSGQLSFPYAGTVNAAGMTIQELQDTLVQRLSRVFKSPQLSVRVEAFRSKRAYVEGDVGNRGLQIFTDIPMTLAESLARAGGVLATGDRSAVTLTRDGKTTQLDLNAMADAGIAPSQIPLKSGDLIFVRSREERKVSVFGEVSQQAGVLMRNGKLSLNDALTEVGGVNLASANPRQIYVIRNEAQGGQSIFHLDARTPTSLAMAEGFALRPKDVVYVDPVPLVQWNRVLSLILPTSTTATSYRDLSTRRAGQ
ncbi:polysaccharide export protein Wza [Variovorax sp. SRS16]|uniref:polysaccharide biosynthesis/export family protein n=1 Tax=Variovorax sp. SRS16 TaxID=282217 RepID=UPI001317B379|nr:polysaccharide biosynthesis/export family protein [Variovorax sp. SRS16]VTU27458.1 polysaccharide export protein Wza [Variovorax sp. SRS16]